MNQKLDRTPDYVSSDSEQQTPTINPADPSSPPLNPSSQTLEPTPPKGRSRKLWFGVGVVVTLIAMGGIAYSLLGKTEDKTAVTPKYDIPVLNVATLSPLPHTYYPDISNDTLQIDINSQIFEGLTKFVDGTTVEPALATSWTNPNSSTWVFNLRQGVTFHTGKTLVATDVKASLEAIKETEYGDVFASTIKAVDVVDATTVKITTDGPDPLLANKLANLFIYDTTSAKKNDPANGTGPYTLKSDNDTDIKLSAYDQYYGGHVYTREVVYLGYEDTEALPEDQLKSRSIQLIASTQDVKELNDKLTADGYQSKKLTTYAVAHLVFNTQKNGSPLAKVAVRKAIAQAIDAKALIPLGDPSATQINQTVPKGIPGYNPNIKDIAYSTTEAKNALATAGYASGFSFKLTYYPSPGNQKVVEEVKKQLATINVTVQLDPQSDQQTLGSIAITGKTDMYFATISSSYVDASDILSDFIDTPNYSNAKVTALNDKAATELDQTKRLDLLKQMSAAIQDDQADIPLYQRSAAVAYYDPSIVFRQDTSSAVLGVNFWQVYKTTK